jgi:hypothetical protein
MLQNNVGPDEHVYFLPCNKTTLALMRDVTPGLLSFTSFDVC